MEIDSARIGAYVGNFFWPFLRLSAFLLQLRCSVRAVCRVRITIVWR